MEIIYNEDQIFSKMNLSTFQDLSVSPANSYILYRIGVEQNGSLNSVKMLCELFNDQNAKSSFPLTRGLLMQSSQPSLFSSGLDSMQIP